MKREKERRRWPRETFPTSKLAIIYPQYKKKEKKDLAPEDKCDCLLVNVLDISEGGILLESSIKFKVGSLLNIRIQHHTDESLKVWMAFKGKVIRVDKSPANPGYYCIGVKSQVAKLNKEVPSREVGLPKKGLRPSDVQFLMHTKLLDAIPQEAKCHLLNCMTPKYLKAGERLISQGDEGDSFYVIQDGTCVIKVEKEGKLYPVAHIKTGNIVGEMAIVTGERRTAHVDAQTDMKLWGISRTQFDEICNVCPDLRDFLTEIVANRFSSSRRTADRTIGKYVINEIIGRGGFSIVYKGIHPILNMPVAIKMLKHDMAMDPDFSEQFMSEAKTIARLNHENIVNVYDIEELYRTIFIIMEYLEGMPLDYILEKMPRPSLRKMLDILLQVCTGIAYAHEQGVVHRDIKPANIWIQPDGRVKIVDFGLACAPGTEVGLFEGTIFYMSPEQIDGDFVDERTDIYSLGIMAYRMITGQRPFINDKFANVMKWHLHEDVPDPHTLIPDLPDELYNFLMRATRKDPAERYKNMWEILNDLRPLAKKMGVKTLPQLRKRKMMSLFLFYKDENQLALNQLVENFSNELKKIETVLRVADFKDV
jgi:serine/threonine protein kinase